MIYVVPSAEGKVDNGILLESELSKSARWFHAVVCANINTELGNISNEEVAKSLDITSKTIYNLQKELINSGWALKHEGTYMDEDKERKVTYFVLGDSFNTPKDILNLNGLV